MTTREKLEQAHSQMDELSKERSAIDKDINSLLKKKAGIDKKITKNMLYRNRLISEL